MTGIHGSSFWDLIPPLRLRRHGRVREVTKFHVAIRDNGTLCAHSSALDASAGGVGFRLPIDTLLGTTIASKGGKGVELTY